MNEEMVNQPHFAHDCTACVFLGGYVWNEDYYDLYWCMQLGKFPTVIARWSDNGQDYLSGIPSEGTQRTAPWYAPVVAYERAKMRGLQVEV